MQRILDEPAFLEISIPLCYCPTSYPDGPGFPPTKCEVMQFLADLTIAVFIYTPIELELD